MSATTNIAATPHHPSPDLAIAIRDAVAAWYAAHNNNAADFNHTLLSTARFCADLITDTPRPEAQRQALATLVVICAVNCGFQNKQKYGANPDGTAVAQNFH